MMKICFIAYKHIRDCVKILLTLQCENKTSINIKTLLIMSRFIYEHCEFKKLSDGSFVCDYSHHTFFSSFQKCVDNIKDYLRYLQLSCNASESTFVNIKDGSYACICFTIEVNGELQYHGVYKRILL